MHAVRFAAIVEQRIDFIENLSGIKDFRNTGAGNPRKPVSTFVRPFTPRSVGQRQIVLRGSSRQQQLCHLLQADHHAFRNSDPDGASGWLSWGESWAASHIDPKRQRGIGADQEVDASRSPKKYSRDDSRPNACSADSNQTGLFRGSFGFTLQSYSQTMSFPMNAGSSCNRD